MTSHAISLELSDYVPSEVENRFRMRISTERADTLNF